MSAATPPAVPPAASVQDAPGLVNRTWTLARIGDNNNPVGNGGKPVTLRIETEPNAIAAGNAGCNRYTGPYTIRGDSISFGPSISTKMACVQGMDVEQSYLSMLPGVLRYAVADSTLTFFGAGGIVAEYRDRTDANQ